MSDNLNHFSVKNVGFYPNGHRGMWACHWSRSIILKSQVVSLAISNRGPFIRCTRVLVSKLLSKHKEKQTLRILSEYRKKAIPLNLSLVSHLGVCFNAVCMEFYKRYNNNILIGLFDNEENQRKTFDLKVLYIFYFITNLLKNTFALK